MLIARSPFKAREDCVTVLWLW